MSMFSLILPVRNSTTIARSPAAIETMSDTPSDLEELRRRIDEIDDRLHDLLIERDEIVARVGGLKQQQRRRRARISPAARREIMRRLVARNSGALPAGDAGAACGASCSPRRPRMQGTFVVAVYAPPEAPGFWDLARDHYGSHTPMLPIARPAQVIRAVTEGQAAVGVLPMPQRGRRRPVVAASAVERRATRRTSSPGCRSAAAAMPAPTAPSAGDRARRRSSRPAATAPCCRRERARHQPRPHVRDAGRRSASTARFMAPCEHAEAAPIR